MAEQASSERPAKRVKKHAGRFTLSDDVHDEGPADVVLIGQDGWKAKVHKSALRLNCTMFKDLFQASEPGDVEETDGGIPIIRVHETPEQLPFILPHCYNVYQSIPRLSEHNPMS